VKREDIRACVLRVGGTNCDAETKRSLEELGVHAEVLHMNEMVRRRNMFSYDALVFPGGFSYGDYVRAGAIWARWMLVRLGKELEEFVAQGRPVLGICNGFQVLVEMGLLPAFEGVSPCPEAVLATNVPPGYDCRWVRVKHWNGGKCVFTRKVPRGGVLRLPAAHAEGRFLLAKEKQKRQLQQLCENDQVVFRYCDENGESAEGRFPVNPSGAFHDIAGICNVEGTVLGLMPHPERAFYWWQQPDWTRQKQLSEHGDGKMVFEGLIDYLTKKF